MIWQPFERGRSANADDKHANTTHKRTYSMYSTANQIERAIQEKTTATNQAVLQDGYVKRTAFFNFSCVSTGEPRSHFGTDQNMLKPPTLQMLVCMMVDFVRSNLNISIALHHVFIVHILLVNVDIHHISVSITNGIHTRQLHRFP